MKMLEKERERNSRELERLLKRFEEREKETVRFIHE
jgi:hypothetical protein